MKGGLGGVFQVVVHVRSTAVQVKKARMITDIHGEQTCGISFSGLRVQRTGFADPDPLCGNSNWQLSGRSLLHRSYKGIPTRVS